MNCACERLRISSVRLAFIGADSNTGADPESPSVLGIVMRSSFLIAPCRMFNMKEDQILET